MVSKFGHLKVIVETLLETFSSIGNIMLLLLLLMYIYGVVACNIFETYTQNIQDQVADCTDSHTCRCCNCIYVLLLKFWRIDLQISCAWKVCSARPGFCVIVSTTDTRSMEYHLQLSRATLRFASASGHSIHCVMGMAGSICVPQHICWCHCAWISSPRNTRQNRCERPYTPFNIISVTRCTCDSQTKNQKAQRCLVAASLNVILMNEAIPLRNIHHSQRQSGLMSWLAS